MALLMSANPHSPGISVEREGVIAFQTSCAGTWSRNRNAIWSRRRLSPSSENVRQIGVFFIEMKNALFRFKSVFSPCMKMPRKVEPSSSISACHESQVRLYTEV
jgi:hypothetical protein